jgi:hypothetical protein
MRALSIAVFVPILTAASLSHLHAQAVTGALAGRVLSAQGEPLENAAVTVSGPFVQGTRDATSDARGRFLVLWLPAGTYTVQLRALGYAPVALHDVPVELGATGSLGDVRLTPQTVQLSEVVVSGARPLIDPTSAAAATVLDSSAFLALPTERNFRALLPLVPAASPSPFGDEANVAGATGDENAYFVDGMHVTEVFNAHGSLNLPYNFVREVQVTTGGYEAEFGHAHGGLVNAVTNSGGNEFHGQVLGFFTGNQLRATPRWGVGQQHVDRFSQYDVGVSLGGPIRRDRLWFYVAYNPTFERRDVTFSRIPTQHDVRTTHLFAAKLSGRLGRGTDVTLTLIGDPSRRDAVDAIEQELTDPRGALSRRSEGGTAVALQARHRLGGRVFLDWSLVRLDRRRNILPATGAPADLLSLGYFVDNVTDTAAGNYGFIQSASQSRTAAQAIVTVLAGSHVVRLGAAYEVNFGKYDQQLSIVHRSLDSAGAPYYTWLWNHMQERGRNAIPALFAEDSWEVGPRLRVNLGLRWEAQFLSGDTGSAFWIAPEIAPRFGVVYQPGEIGTQKLYVSAGRFYEQIAMWSMANCAGSWVQNNVAFDHNPLADSTGGTLLAGFSGAGEVPNRDIKGQHLDEVTIGYERRLGLHHRIGVRGALRTLRWAVNDGLDSTWAAVIGNPGRGTMAIFPRARRDYAGLEFSLERSGGPLHFLVSYVLSRNWGNYSGLYMQEGGGGIAGDYGNSNLMFTVPDQMNGATGPLPVDRTHVVKLAGSYRWPMGLSLGASAVLASGVPLSEYGASIVGYSYVIFVRPRGTAGRTPTTWNVDLRFAYDLPVRPGSRIRPRLQLDVFNVGNQRRPLMYDQMHYTTADQAGLNPNYGLVSQYQAPLSARVGMLVNF